MSPVPAHKICRSRVQYTIGAPRLAVSYSRAWNVRVREPPPWKAQCALLLRSVSWSVRSVDRSFRIVQAQNNNPLDCANHGRITGRCQGVQLEFRPGYGTTGSQLTCLGETATSRPLSTDKGAAIQKRQPRPRSKEQTVDDRRPSSMGARERLGGPSGGDLRGAFQSSVRASSADVERAWMRTHVCAIWRRTDKRRGCLFERAR